MSIANDFKTIGTDVSIGFTISSAVVGAAYTATHLYETIAFNKHVAFYEKKAIKEASQELKLDKLPPVNSDKMNEVSCLAVNKFSELSDTMTYKRSLSKIVDVCDIAKKIIKKSAIYIVSIGVILGFAVGLSEVFSNKK